MSWTKKTTPMMSELHILEPAVVRWRDADYAYHINYTRTELIEHLNAIREREQWREQYGKRRDRRKDDNKIGYRDIAQSVLQTNRTTPKQPQNQEKILKRCRKTCHCRL